MSRSTGSYCSTYSAGLSRSSGWSRGTVGIRLVVNAVSNCITNQKYNNKYRDSKNYLDEKSSSSRSPFLITTSVINL